MAELCTHLATERARLETLRLRMRAPVAYPTDARAATIGRVVCNHRFLLLPGVRVYGLASEVLRLAAQRVAEDWECRYSVRPVAAYTHVGVEHGGYCYHCAGWTVVGRTSERRSEAGTVRATALAADWRETLCHVERRPVGGLAGAFDGAEVDSSEREYSHTGHTDGRVRDRIVRLHALQSLRKDILAAMLEAAFVADSAEEKARN